MEVGGGIIWVSAVVTVVLMNRERKEERGSMPLRMGKIIRTDLHLAKTSVVLPILVQGYCLHQVAESHAKGWD